MSVTPVTMSFLKDAVASSVTTRGDVPEKTEKKPEKEPPKEAEIEAPAKTMLKIDGTTIAFEIDGDLSKVVVKVMDKESGEVLREIPPEIMREIAKTLNDAAGKLLNTVV